MGCFLSTLSILLLKFLSIFLLTDVIVVIVARLNLLIKYAYSYKLSGRSWIKGEEKRLRKVEDGSKLG